MIENADLAESFDMVGVIAGPSSMRVLNVKRYPSSPRFYHFVKYRVPIKEPARKRRKLFDNLAVLNLREQNRMHASYASVNNKEIEDAIQRQIQKHQNNSRVRKKWENTRTFIEYAANISDEELFLFFDISKPF